MSQTTLSAETREMPRKRIHLSGRERTAAWRKKNAHKLPPKKLQMAQLAFELCAAVRLAAMASDPAAASITAERDDQLMLNLIKTYSEVSKSPKTNT